MLFGSTSYFSAQNTGSPIEALLRALFGQISPRHLAVAHFLIRKLAHLSEYGILAWLLFRAFRHAPSGWQWRWAEFALAGVLLIAVVDELHQHFVPSRTGSPVDVVIDLCGGMFALALLRGFASAHRDATSAS